MAEMESDRISALPSEVLVHILSFLPTKDAVGTTTLSKRWKNLWISVENLEFDDSLVFNRNKHGKNPDAVASSFVNFVNRVLALYRGPGIKRFGLNTLDSSHSCNLDSWISKAIALNVSELDLCFSWRTCELPTKLLTCEKLVSLKLSCPELTEFNYRESVWLPSLKVLDVTFVSNEIIAKLVSNSPVLDKLFIVQNPILNLERLDLQSSSLNSLSIRTTDHDDEVSDSAIVLDTSNLKFLKLVHNYPPRYKMVNTSEQVKADINFRSDGAEFYCESNYERVLKILKQISNVKELCLSEQTLEVLFDASSYKLCDSSSDCGFPVFNNLNCLEVRVRGNGWLVLPTILKSSPNLKSFIINKMNGNPNKNTQSHTIGRVWNKPVGQCLLDSLEEIRITGFESCIEEMEMMEYLLKNAMLLKRMTIFSCRGLASEQGSDVFEKVTMFSRGSRTCRIFFV